MKMRIKDEFGNSQQVSVEEIDGEIYINTAGKSYKLKLEDGRPIMSYLSCPNLQEKAETYLAV